MAETPTIGEMRWRVMIARRRQMFDPPGHVGITEDYVDIQMVHAKILSIGSMVFYGAQQVAQPVTHKISCRWLNYLDTSNVILRATRLPDTSIRVEVFHVQRVMEIEGRKRFSVIEANLEKTLHQPAGSAQPRMPTSDLERT